MSGGADCPQGERIASLESDQKTDRQSIRDLWTSLKEEEDKRERGDKSAGDRLAKVELFQGRIALLMAIGGALGLTIFGAAMSYLANLIKALGGH